MAHKGNKTAPYKIIADSGGNRYRFFCEASHAVVCVTGPVNGPTPEEELLLAWESEGRHHFNRCQNCGKWICDTMYNADTLECVDCSPWEEAPHYCSHCGLNIPSSDIYCKKCGTRLRYKEVWA